jgi:hypothetical protein
VGAGVLTMTGSGGGGACKVVSVATSGRDVSAATPGARASRERCRDDSRVHGDGRGERPEQREGGATVNQPQRKTPATGNGRRTLRGGEMLAAA